jgi:hypothetical protein
MTSRVQKAAMNFTKMMQKDVPQGRNGKHKAIVTKILSDLDQIQGGVALKVPLADLADTKANVRSALNRATRKRGQAVSTASVALLFLPSLLPDGIEPADPMIRFRGLSYPVSYDRRHP